MQYQKLFIVLITTLLFFIIFFLYKNNVHYKACASKNSSAHDIPIDSLENQLRGYAWDVALEVVKSMQSSQLARATEQERKTMFMQAYLKALQEKSKTLSHHEKEVMSEKITRDQAQRIVSAINENKPTNVSLDQEMEALEYGQSVQFLADVKWDTAGLLLSLLQSQRDVLTLLDLKKIYMNVLQEKLALLKNGQ